METKEDQQGWKIIIENTKCRNIYYATDYIGCKILPDRADRCTIENCPIMIMEDEE